jgi:ribosomal protein S18 acetylase RimI-like enzyme
VSPDFVSLLSPAIPRFSKGVPVPDLSFRPVTTADTPFLAEVYRASRWEELQPTGWDDAQKRAFLRQQFECQTSDWNRSLPKAKREIILVDGHLAGRLYTDTRSQSRELRVVDIALLPDFRRRGIASRIFAQLIEDAEKNGWEISLHVEHNNPARRLYDRIGFVPVRNEGVYLFMTRPCAAGGSPAANLPAPAP